ncbi:hypothetical protein V2J09_006144 [Rumex salicifolius]
MVEMKESGSVAVAPTPQPQRRPRVREVSSRFMSPLVSPATSSSDHNHHHSHVPIRAKSPLQRSAPSTPSDFQSRHRRSNSVQRQRNSDQETDENRPEINVFRSSETLTGAHCKAAVKLFKERAGGDIPRRVDTPTVTSTMLRSRKANSCNLTSAAESAAAKLLHLNGLSSGGSRGGGGGAPHRDPSPKSSPVKSSANSSCVNKSDSKEVLSSSLRSSSDGNENGVNGGDCLRPGASPLSRSLTLPFSSGNGKSIFDSVRSSDKLVSSSLKGLNGVKGGGGGVCLPPMPPLASSKVGPTEGKKGTRKGLSQQDDMHKLKMLHNHYLQWRLANAKAEASMIAQKMESETTLYSLGVKLSELQESVKSKREEVKQLQRAKALSTVLEAQMPYLDDWSHLEGDYSSALMETTQCLLNVSSQLPLAGNTRVDVRELSDAMKSAVKTMDLIFTQVNTFYPQAEEVGTLGSEMAGVFSGEQALIQECRDLLSKANASQVIECCLRSKLMQFLQLNHLAWPKQECEVLTT